MRADLARRLPESAAAARSRPHPAREHGLHRPLGVEEAEVDLDGGILRDARGWTLTELLVGMGIMTVLAAIAMPQYALLAAQMRATGAAARLLSEVNFARTMSERTMVSHYINIDAGTGLAYQVRRLTGASPNTAVDPVVHRVTDTGTRFNRGTSSTDCYGGATTAAVPTTPLVFNARGLPTNTAGGSFFISDPQGGNTRVVTVTAAGRARICTWTGGTWR